jgi:hypothetical protein
MRPSVVVLAAVSLCACPAPEETPVPTCNGSAALCDKTWDDVTLLGTHNSMSALHASFGAPNQRLSISEQLDFGVKALLIDTYLPDDSDDVLLCHGTCAFGSTPLSTALDLVNRHLEDNAGDVLELLVEDHAPTDAFAAAVRAAGLEPRVITHVAGEPWPTLRELVDDDTRLFITVENSGPPPPWVHAMFEQYVDTPFTFASVEELRAPESCDANRGSDDNQLLLVNHFVGNPLPSEELSAQANAGDVLRERVSRCAEARGKRPHVLAVDWADEGDAPAVVDELNASTL